MKNWQERNDIVLMIIHSTTVLFIPNAAIIGPFRMIARVNGRYIDVFGNSAQFE
jgi:hypothetical protein